MGRWKLQLQQSLSSQVAKSRSKVWILLIMVVLLVLPLDTDSKEFFLSICIQFLASCIDIVIPVCNILNENFFPNETAGEVIVF